MTFVQLEALVPSSLSLLLTAILLAMVVAWVWAFQRIARGVSLSPQHPIRPLSTAHWGAGTILLVIVLYLGANIAVGVGYSVLTGPSGADPGGARAGAKAAPGEPKAGEALNEAKHRGPFEIILLTCVANLAFCVLAFPLLRWLVNVGPSDLGLFVDRWPLQVWLGVVAALLTTPTTYALQLIATSIWRVSEHPVQKMMMDQFTPGVAALAFFSTVILAPLVEETMFRGVFQRWLTRLFDQARQSAPPPLPDSPLGETAATEPSADRTEEVLAAPALITEESPGARPAIVVTSFLFAAMHGSQWPDPVALFVFSLVLGGVYQKTGSLLAAMVTHGVFNAFSTLLLMVQLSAHHLKG